MVEFIDSMATLVQQSEIIGKAVRLNLRGCDSVVKGQDLHAKVVWQYVLLMAL